MGSVIYALQHGPDTFEVNAAVTGGQLVMPDSTTGKIKPATADAATVLGVAAADANPVGTDTATNFANPRPHVAVYYGPVDVKVTYTDAAAFGVKLKAAASGQVTPWVSGTDAAGLIVGICTEPAGVAAGAKGRIRLTV